MPNFRGLTLKDMRLKIVSRPEGWYEVWRNGELIAEIDKGLPPEAYHKTMDILLYGRPPSIKKQPFLHP